MVRRIIPLILVLVSNALAQQVFIPGPGIGSGASLNFNGFSYQRSITIPFGQVFAGSYTSGITTVGTTGQTCILTFSNGGGTGGTATVALTGTSAIAGGTILTLTAFGSAYTSAPTTATVAAGTATSCNGTATIATVLQAAQTNFTQLICANGSAPCNGTVSGLNQSGGGAHVQNLVNGLAYAIYVTGITATGAAGTTCAVSGFNNGLTGAIGYLTLTSLNTISTSGNASITITNPGHGATSAPTSASTVAPGGPNPASSCSGTSISFTGAQLYTVPADLVFTSDAGCVTTLPFEIDNSYNASTGSLYAHVLVSPSGTANTVIYMCYGKAAIISSQGWVPGPAYDSNTWGVWHLGNGSALNLNDSGPNGYSLYQIGTVTYAATTSAQVDGGINYTVNASNGAPSQQFNAGFASALTMECWINPTGTLSSTQPTIISHTVGTPTNDWYMQILGTTSVRLDIDNSASTVTFTGGAAITQTGMQHLVGVANGTDYIVYLNGAQAGLTANTHVAAGGSGYVFALGNDNASPQPYLGILDECSVSSTARSASWIAMEYGMAAAPYVVFGSEI